MMLAGVVTLVVTWLVLVLMDWNRYDPMQNSAPFWAFMLARAIVVLSPAVVLLIAALILRLNPKTPANPD